MAKTQYNPPNSVIQILSKHVEQHEIYKICIVGICLILSTLLFGAYRVTDFMIFIILVMSWDLLYGCMGRLSFGQYLYFGAGAYGAGLFVRYISSNPLIAIFMGMIVAAILAIILGTLTVRATGACFSMINAAFNRVGWFIVVSPLRWLTSGKDGFGIRPAKLGVMNFALPEFRFWFVLGSLIVVLWLLRSLISSPYGLVVRAIKENETRVRFSGYNTFKYKWIAFVIAGVIAGFAGALNALNYSYVNPNSIDVHANIGVVFACLLGGAGNFYGAVIGGFVFMLISNYLPLYFSRWELFLGISLLVIVFRFRLGILGTAQTWWGNFIMSGKAKDNGESLNY